MAIVGKGIDSWRSAVCQVNRSPVKAADTVRNLCWQHPDRSARSRLLYPACWLAAGRGHGVLSSAPRVLYDLGQFDEAELEWREQAAECDRLLGADHPDAIEAHEYHALTLARLDRVSEAEPEMAQVVEKLTAANGSDDAATLGARTSHAVYLDTLGRHAESEAAWRGLADAKGRVLGRDHADTIAARERLAVTMYAQRRLGEAAVEYGECSGPSDRYTRRRSSRHQTGADLAGENPPGTRKPGSIVRY